MSYRLKEWTLWDSNPRLPACKADVLANWTKGPETVSTVYFLHLKWIVVATYIIIIIVDET